jgi:hypothetical protein
MLHAIVIVGFDPDGGGYYYLDSLRASSKPLPNESSFEQDYGISFIDAWNGHVFVIERED